MALIYITGAPGAGKSTICEELSKRGFETHDMDDPDLGGAHNKLSGERVKIPPAHARTPKWYEDHEWRVYVEALQALKMHSGKQSVFVCGVAPDDSAALPIFDKVIYLTLSDEELIKRIEARKGNDYGKNQFELDTILKRKAVLDEKHSSRDSICLSAQGSVSKVVDDILAMS